MKGRNILTQDVSLGKQKGIGRKLYRNKQYLGQACTNATLILHNAFLEEFGEGPIIEEDKIMYRGQ